MGKHTREILIRVPESQHDGLVKAKLEISNNQGREVTWYEILKAGAGTLLAYGPIGGDDVAPRNKKKR